MELIKPIEPIYPTSFNTRLEKKVEEKKSKKKAEDKPTKSFADYLKEALNN